VAGCWHAAYRSGLADPPLRRAATALAGLALGRLEIGLPAGVRTRITDTVQRRLRGAGTAEEP
jgi:glutamate--cysteine ligase